MQQSINTYDYIVSSNNPNWTLAGAVAESQDADIQIGVYFDIIQEHSVSLQSQITENYMENNTAIADHIANAPIKVSLRGVSGEVVYVPSITEESTQGLSEGGALTKLYNFTNGKIGNVSYGSEKLTSIVQLLPPVDNITQLAKNAVTSIEASFNRYKKIIKDFTNPEIKEQKIRKIYRNLCTLRENKTALIVHTPYDIFDNMYIESITLRQGNIKYITDIELTLKQVYFSETETTAPDKAVLDKYNQWQRASIENHGKMNGVKKSIAAQIFDGDKITLFGN